LKVTIYSKKECHLCEEAHAVLERVAQHYPFEIEEVDIERDPELFAKYSEEIPVIFLEGRKLFKYKVDEKQLIRALKSRGRF
jgi:glutaredoxin